MYNTIIMDLDGNTNIECFNENKELKTLNIIKTKTKLSDQNIIHVLLCTITRNNHTVL